MQNFNLKCKEHPTRTISYIYVQQICPYTSRLACSKCIMQKEQKLEGYFDIQDFLADPTNILSTEQQSSHFNELNAYFQKTQKEPYEVIQYYKNRINDLIDNLKLSLEEGIQQYIKFQESVGKAKIQLIESLNHKLLIKQFENIQGTQNFHDGKEWVEFENYVSAYFEQFSIQENQELKETLHILRENEKDFFDSQIIRKFSRDFNFTVGQMIQDLLHMGTKNHFLQNIQCSNLFSRKLLAYIDKNQRFIPKLIFKGTQLGMNADSFWQYCQGKGPTLIICKSKNGTVFGGYTPLKWLADENGRFDRTQKSFLFNCNREEFYPNIGDYSIYSSSAYGPCFSNGIQGQSDLIIRGDFQDGYSSLGNNYQADINQSKYTRLMGAEKPNLIEMEVYLIQKI